MARPTFQPPKGTRDFYPQELLVRRYITDAWRRVALRHGFDEIDGPTFETAALYKVKSGDAILGEMFGVFSGKDPEDVAAAGRGDPPFVLRPEFTPTLARMYAAKAAQLPKPTKWFCVPNFFRAERPQRGRLREFMQFNVDALADETVEADLGVIGCAVGLFLDLGFSSRDVQVRINNRHMIADAVARSGSTCNVDDAFRTLDKRAKLPADVFAADCAKIGFNIADFDALVAETRSWAAESRGATQLNELTAAFSSSGMREWITIDPAIVRGLAYYTGTVFEVIAEGERAVAGGGRYDNLVELFGGPPTPACGFGMGDVVLGNLLTDKGLMPEGKDLLDAVSRPMPVRPDAFVIASNDEAAAHLTSTVAQLRRGTESPEYLAREARKPWDADRYSIPPLHARRSYKATKNVGKLLADASACHARFAVILESPEKATIKNLDTGAQHAVATSAIGAEIAGRL